MAKTRKSSSAKKTLKIDTLLKDKKFSLQERIFFAFVLILFVFNIFIPQVGRAQSLLGNNAVTKTVISSPKVDVLTEKFQEAEEKYVNLSVVEKTVNIQKTVKENKPQEVETEFQASTPEPENGRVMYVQSSAYSSTVDQCDATPCITADGFNVCANGQENVVAANFLPLGTKIMIPELFGDRVFTVHDRMNARYYYKVDIWMTSRERALQYGVRNIKIVILPA